MIERISLRFGSLMMIILYLTSCGNNEEKREDKSEQSQSSDFLKPYDSTKLEAIPLSLEKPEVIKDNRRLTYSDIKDKEFVFRSGVGAWRTIIKIKSNGSFTGYYYDQDSDIIYECRFSGKFSPLKRAGPYTYRMKCLSLKTYGKKGQKRIEGDKTYITHVPYGFEKLGRFYLYLPGKKRSELSEEFMSWEARYYINDQELLTSYGLYNERDEKGFVVLKE